MGTAFVIFGPQGSGKSTQVELLARHLNFEVFEAGQVLRQRSANNESLHHQLTEGVLVSDEVIFNIANSYIKEHNAPGYIFDGYPRNLDQCIGFQRLVTAHQWQAAAIFINLSDESAKTRLSTRYEMVGGKKVIREDDKPEIVEKRLDTFKQQTLPIKEWFRTNYRLLEIDGEPSIETVATEVNDAVNIFLHGQS